MGNPMREGTIESKKRGRRGSVKNLSRLEAFTGGRKKGSAEWATCGPEKIAGVVCAITEKGGAVTFGLSRDEGAHSVTLLLDDSRATMWYNGDANLDDCLTEIIDTLSQLD